MLMLSRADTERLLDLDSAVAAADEACRTSGDADLDLFGQASVRV